MKTVLVVEDNANNRYALSGLLRRKGFVPIECGTLKEAFQIHALGRIDCVVLDLGLPDSDYEDTLLNIPKFNNTPVMVYTGIEDATLPGKALQAGASNVILKGSSAETIVEKIRLGLARQNPEDEENGREIFANRRENFHSNPRLPWLTTANTIIALVVAMAVQAATLVQYIRSNSAHAALLEKKVDDTAEITKKHDGQITQLEERAINSINDRAGMNKRLDTYASEQSAIRGKIDEGFNRVQDKQDHLSELLMRAIMKEKSE